MLLFWRLCLILALGSSFTGSTFGSLQANSSCFGNLSPPTRFFYLDDVVLFSNAQQKCNENGLLGDLAAITSLDEYNAALSVYSLIPSNKRKNFFLGIVDVGQTGGKSTDRFTYMSTTQNFNTAERLAFLHVDQGQFPWASEQPADINNDKFCVRWNISSHRFEAVLCSIGNAVLCRKTCTDIADSVPTTSPTGSPTTKPTTLSPTRNPIKEPTTLSPTKSPTKGPTTLSPTKSPTHEPATLSPTNSPTKERTTLNPTNEPTTVSPTRNPTKQPTEHPTDPPSTVPPTRSPTLSPTKNPINEPVTLSPTKNPFEEPATLSPTKNPTKEPTKSPTDNHSNSVPTKNPTLSPSKSPTTKPTVLTPTRDPTHKPTMLAPTRNPTHKPTKSPTNRVPPKVVTSPPTHSPTLRPTFSPLKDFIPSNESPSADNGLGLKNLIILIVSLCLGLSFFLFIGLYVRYKKSKQRGRTESIRKKISLPTNFTSPGHLQSGNPRNTKRELPGRNSSLQSPTGARESSVAAYSGSSSDGHAVDPFPDFNNGPPLFGANSYDVLDMDPPGIDQAVPPSVPPRMMSSGFIATSPPLPKRLPKNKNGLDKDNKFASFTTFQEPDGDDGQSMFTMQTGNVEW